MIDNYSMAEEDLYFMGPIFLLKITLTHALRFLWRPVPTLVLVDANEGKMRIKLLFTYGWSLIVNREDK